MVLNFSKPANDSYHDVVRVNFQFVTKSVPAFLPLSINSEIQSQWNNRKLRRTADLELFTNFATLLFADDNNSIRTQPGKNLFDRQKRARLYWSIVAVKNVAVISVNETTLTRA